MALALVNNLCPLPSVAATSLASLPTSLVVGTNIEKQAKNQNHSLGMVFGFLGDLFLASVLPAPDRVLASIAAFAVCHVFYILAITGFGNRFGLNDSAFSPGICLAICSFA
jgi:FtsH-binding integral membrane protein